VGADEDTKRRARMRWRSYADAGFVPAKHDL
jgi:DNA polymerase IIIc chi subunit